MLFFSWPPAGSVTISGAATESKQDDQITILQAIETSVEILDNAISGNEMQVDVVSSALPSGAATSANQTTANTALAAIQTAIEILDNTVSGNEMQVDVVSSALPTGAATEAKQDSQITELQAIKTAVEVLDNAVSGSEMQVDIVAALPAGTNNIGDVDVLSLPSLPAGTNNIGDVDVLSLPSIPAGANTIGSVTQSGTWTVQPGNTQNTTAWLTQEEKSGTATLANVAGSASSVTLQASNSDRKGWSIHNDSSAILYVKFGSSASSTSYTVKLIADAYYELPTTSVYTGIITGIWASATGSARVTELT
jgi:hypothetical protein